MQATEPSVSRDRLLEQRQKLEIAADTLGRTDEVMRLMQEVDAALERMNAGTFGVCATCNEAIEPNRLLADPLMQFCLDHLTPVEQHALQQDLELASRMAVSRV